MALLEVQELAFDDALDARPAAAELPDYVADRVMSRVVDCSVVHGPPALADLGGPLLDGRRLRGGDGHRFLHLRTPG